MSKPDEKRPSLARRLPLWAFAVFAGVVFGTIIMLATVIIGLQLHLAALAGAAVCCTTVSLVSFVEAAAELFMAIVEAILSAVGAVLAAIAGLFAGFS